MTLMMTALVMMNCVGAQPVAYKMPKQEVKRIEKAAKAPAESANADYVDWGVSQWKEPPWGYNVDIGDTFTITESVNARAPKWHYLSEKDSIPFLKTLVTERKLPVFVSTCGKQYKNVFELDSVYLYTIPTGMETVVKGILEQEKKSWYFTPPPIAWMSGDTFFTKKQQVPSANTTIGRVISIASNYAGSIHVITFDYIKCWRVWYQSPDVRWSDAVYSRTQFYSVKKCR
jgi:hypothetical protein